MAKYGEPAPKKNISGTHLSSSVSSINEAIQSESQNLLTDIKKNKLGRLLLIVSAQLLGVLLIQLLILINSNSTQKWEYQIISPSDSKFDEKMNEMGNEGWELITARRATSSYSSSASYEMIFKRKK